MNPRARKRGRWFLLLSAALLALLYPVQRDIGRDPAYPQEYNRPVLNIREGGTLAMMAMMGGFRPMVVNLLWLRTDAYWHGGATGWWRMLPMLQAICEMDPHFIDAWSTFAWHCAWNIYADAAPEDRPKWVETGIKIFKRGISYNRDRYDLYKDLAWLYHDKMRNYELAIPAWKDVLKHPDAPIYCRHMLAHAYENTWQVEKAMETWRECVKLDRYDFVAHNALDWWTEQTSSKAKLDVEKIRILQRENAMRRSRGLPMMEQPQPIR